MINKKINFRSSEDRELGFGTSVNSSGQRFMNKDGTSNIARLGVKHFNPINIYHDLISISWKRFFFFVFSGYFILNSLFAFIYVAIGLENLTGIQPGDFSHNFWEGFFFSSQSFTTVGYGRVAPISKLASSIAAFESLLGLLSLAIATGLLYGRFSRPTAAILYSEKILIAPYKNITGLMVRVANARKNQLIEVEASIIAAFNSEVNGKIQRRFQNLELELKKINFLTMSWTIVHPVDEQSPLYGLTKEDLKAADLELLILIKGIDDTYATTVYSRSSYKHDEVVVGAKFNSIFGQTTEGRTSINLEQLSNFTLITD